MVTIKSYTVDGLCEYLCDGDNIPPAIYRFKKRISECEWTPEIILMWKCTEDQQTDIDNWIETKPFNDRYNRSYLQQLEFEFEEDAMAFKLKWT